jgi:hypothetical protein
VNGILLSHKKNEIKSFVAETERHYVKGNNPSTERSLLCVLVHMQKLEKFFIEVESRTVFSRG